MNIGSSSCWNKQGWCFHQQHVCAIHGAFTILGSVSRSQVGTEHKSKGTVTFLPPLRDGPAAPVKPDKTMMSQTHRQPGKHPACSLRGIWEWKHQLFFPGLAQPGDRLGPVTATDLLGDPWCFALASSTSSPHSWVWWIAGDRNHSMWYWWPPCGGLVVIRCREHSYSCAQRWIAAFFSRRFQVWIQLPKGCQATERNIFKERRDPLMEGVIWG